MYEGTGNGHETCDCNPGLSTMPWQTHTGKVLLQAVRNSVGERTTHTPTLTFAKCICDFPTQALSWSNCEFCVSLCLVPRNCYGPLSRCVCLYTRTDALWSWPSSCREQQKYLPEFSADRAHAMCNFQQLYHSSSPARAFSETFKYKLVRRLRSQ
jgi:hypothetical protein